MNCNIPNLTPSIYSPQVYIGYPVTLKTCKRYSSSRKSTDLHTPSQFSDKDLRDNSQSLSSTPEDGMVRIIGSALRGSVEGAHMVSGELMDTPTYSPSRRSIGGRWFCAMELRFLTSSIMMQSPHLFDIRTFSLKYGNCLISSRDCGIGSELRSW